jgi:hypothetical protein
MHIMGMEAGAITQGSIKKPSEDGRMLIEKRGWMKIIFDLARSGYINWEKACQVFELRDKSRNLALLTGAHK